MARSTNMGREGKDTSQGRGASNADLLLHPELLSQEFIQLVLNEVRDESGLNLNKKRVDLALVS